MREEWDGAYLDDDGTYRCEICDSKITKFVRHDPPRPKVLACEKGHVIYVKRHNVRGE